MYLFVLSITIQQTNRLSYNLHVLTSICREQHLEKKIEQLTTEAKAKMAKKDKKGEFY